MFYFLKITLVTKVRSTKLLGGHVNHDKFCKFTYCIQCIIAFGRQAINQQAA